MPTLDRETSIAAGRPLVTWVQRHFLWLLAACYILAAVWPAPGVAMRQWHVVASGARVTFPLALLATMLFCAAAMTDLAQIRLVLRHPLLLCVAMAAVWLGPALLVVSAGWVVPWLVDGEASAGLLVGLALIAAMPVANSSVGWTQHAGGNLALGLALVVLSISLSPFATPALLEWLGKSLSSEEQRLCEKLVTEFSGWFFVGWVILPTALGFACRLVATPNRIARAADAFALISAAALLLLNYINSALALPQAIESAPTTLITTIALAILLSAVGLALAAAISRALKLLPSTTSSLMFGLSMKHTGLALILADAVLPNEPLAILLIVLATLAQHILAAAVQWTLLRAGRLDQVAIQ